MMASEESVNVSSSLKALGKLESDEAEKVRPSFLALKAAAGVSLTSEPAGCLDMWT